MSRKKISYNVSLDLPGLRGNPSPCAHVGGCKQYYTACSLVLSARHLAYNNMVTTEISGEDSYLASTITVFFCDPTCLVSCGLVLVPCAEYENECHYDWYASDVYECYARRHKRSSRYTTQYLYSLTTDCVATQLYSVIVVQLHGVTFIYV